MYFNFFWEIITARIRRVREGNSFTLCVSPHIDRGGTPFPGPGLPRYRGYPLPRSRCRGTPFPGPGGGTPFPGPGRGCTCWQSVHPTWTWEGNNNSPSPQLDLRRGTPNPPTWTWEGGTPTPTWTWGGRYPHPAPHTWTWEGGLPCQETEQHSEHYATLRAVMPLAFTQADLLILIISALEIFIIVMQTQCADNGQQKAVEDTECGILSFFL